MSLSSPNHLDHPVHQPLTDAARGAVLAFARVVELTEPAVAHRSALRATLSAHIAHSLELASATTAHVIATSAMADIDLSISRPLPEEAPRDGTRAALAATVVDEIPDLNGVATALGHIGERWDGAGEPDGLTTTQIPIEARIAAVTDALVGNPAPGFLPTWETSLQRASRASGARFDPDVVAAVASIDLHGIAIPPSVTQVLAELLNDVSPIVVAPNGTLAATEVAAAVAAASRVEDLLQLFADIAMRSIEAANVSVLRLTKTTIEDSPVAEANDGREPIVTPDRLIDLTEFSTVAEIRAGEPITRMLTDSLAENRIRMQALGLGSELSVPIALNNDTWGVLSAARRADARLFDEHDLEVLHHIAGQASLSLANTIRWEHIEDMALKDQLTGLANRHVLYAVLDEIFERDPVDRQDCAVIMCDVDGLKDVNDTQGHEAGDRLLVDAAIALRGAVRDAERTTICRIGGDEFCLVIDGGALLTAHEISDTIERLYERSGPPDDSRSISCGIAFASTDVETRSQLLRAADENQYETKRLRRAARGEPIAPPERLEGDRRAIR